MNLFVDEAYYWDWSRHLAFGYFSHPPMVAWFIRMARFVLGNNEWQIRFPFAIVGTFTLPLIYYLAKNFFNRRVGLLALAVITASPAYVFASRLAIADQLVITFWVLAMVFFWKGYQNNDNKSYYLFGLFLGLGLLSKYQMFFLLISIIIFILTAGKKHNILKNKAFYKSIIIALLVFAPNVLWNLNNNWATFQFQYHNGTSLSFPNGFSPKEITLNLLSTLRDIVKFQDIFIKFSLILPPVLFIYYGLRKKVESITFLFLTFLPITLFFTLFSGKKHWFFPGMIGAYLIVLYFLDRNFKNRFLLYGLVCAIFFINIISSLKLIDVFTTKNLLPNYLDDSSFQIVFESSNRMKQTVNSLRRQIGYNRANLTIIAENYPLASEIAYYLPNQPQTYAVQGQYLIWGPPKDWKNIAVLAFNKNLLNGGLTEKINTPKYNLYYQYIGNKKPNLAKDWALHFEGP